MAKLTLKNMKQYHKRFYLHGKTVSELLDKIMSLQNNTMLETSLIYL